jgi:hypothetical protein
LGIGDWAQSPIPNPQSPIPNPQIYHLIEFKLIIIIFLYLYLIIINYLFDLLFKQIY